MSTPRHRRVAAGAASMALVGGVFSLLIWGKLRLVGPVPRSAYAEPAPEPNGAADPDAPSPAGDAIDAQLTDQDRAGQDRAAQRTADPNTTPSGPRR